VKQLAQGLARDGRNALLLSAREWGAEDALVSPPGDVPDADALLIEDLQWLPPRSALALEGVIDRAIAHHCQVVATATAGPALLKRLPGRLASRLASGLVVGLAPLGAASRRKLLLAAARHRGVEVPPEVLDWAARHLDGSARRLEAAVMRLAGAATIDEAQAALAEEASRPSIDEVARKVGQYYGVKLAGLCGPSRSRGVLLARQVAMFLARSLTGQTLASVGEFFGGRDHSTVLNACRKVESALPNDGPLALAVREISAGLS
jgi:chromosomal replication initiator protein